MTAVPVVVARGVGPPTAALLWEACRLSPRSERLLGALADGADPRLAAAVSLNGRTGPLLWRALTSIDRLDGLDDALDPLRQEYEIRRAQAALMIPVAVAAAIEPLTAAGMEPVVMKGPAVAMRYPAPGLRPMDDLDVLLPASQHDRAVRVLMEAGWTRFDRPGQHHDTVMFLPQAPGFALELHRSLDTWRDAAHGVRAKDVWDARIPIECMGTKAFGLPPEIELVTLAVHAGKPFHHYSRLIWSVDFAVVVHAAGATFDWDALGRLIRRTATTTLVAVALRHARALGADVPDALLALPRGRHRATAIAPVLDPEWPLTFPDEGTENRLRYALADSRWRRVTLFAGELTREGPRRVPARLALSLWRGLLRWLRSL
jgi:putative nucleotidyltransferase-like protein